MLMRSHDHSALHTISVIVQIAFSFCVGKADNVVRWSAADTLAAADSQGEVLWSHRNFCSGTAFEPDRRTTHMQHNRD
eukprot:20453-Heterococcus_DN1.PRE.2